MPRPLPDLLAHNPLPPAIDCDSQGDQATRDCSVSSYLDGQALSTWVLKALVMLRQEDRVRSYLKRKEP